MKTDVQTLIAALTTERDALDRAIVALRQIRTGEPPRMAEPSARRPRHASKRIYSKRIHLSDHQKTEIVAALKTAPKGQKTEMTRELARRFGIPLSTIQTGWLRWETELTARQATQRLNHNGDDAARFSETGPRE
jgi:hypothetical protein